MNSEVINVFPYIFVLVWGLFSLSFLTHAEFVCILFTQPSCSVRFTIDFSIDFVPRKCSFACVLALLVEAQRRLKGFSIRLKGRVDSHRKANSPKDQFNEIVYRRQLFGEYFRLKDCQSRAKQSIY